MEDIKEQIEIKLSLASNKFMEFIRTLDTQITRNFKNAYIQTRPVNSNGLWCFTLIPAILISYTILYEVSPVYELLAYVSISLITYSLLFILFLYTSCLILTSSYTSGWAVSIFSSTIPIYCILDYDLIIALVFPAIAVGTYSFILKMALYKCPKTFTIGEAMVVSQGFSVALTASALTYSTVIVFPEMEEDEEMKLIKTVVITVLSTVGLLVTALYNLNANHRTIQVLIFLLMVAAVVESVLLKQQSIELLKVVSYIFRDVSRLKLLLLWLSLVVVAMLAAAYRVELALKATSAARKSFHLLAALVFASGALLDLPLITLAAGIGLGVIIFIEALRLSNIQPISSALQSAFRVYSDEKDVGVFAMTPIYLYVGLACPLALVPRGAGGSLELLSGVLAVGVGDTAASWFGERYGTSKWPGTNRTLEGTIANMVSQIVVVYILNLFELVECGHCLVRAGVAGCAAALCEARMEQVDNLMLPLLTVLAFHLTAALR